MIRYEFLDESIKEEDIHPEIVFDEERKLANRFVRQLSPSTRILPCPVCNGHRDEILFRKWGFDYAICPVTWSVGLADLPVERILTEYFTDSDLSRLRASRKYQLQVSSRRRELWEHLIGWMEGRISRYLGNRRYEVIDWGGKYAGWIDCLATAGFVRNLSVEEPLPPIAPQEGDSQPADIITLIDVLQRVRDPVGAIRRVHQRLGKNGLLVATCRAGSGFDVLTLREHAESIFPLDHLFLPSPSGLQRLLEQAGFDVLEITTPGLLDMKYIKKATDDIPRDQFFQRYLVQTMDEPFFERMQGFLQRNNLSSHLRCVARRR